MASTPSHPWFDTLTLAIFSFFCFVCLTLHGGQLLYIYLDRSVPKLVSSQSHFRNISVLGGFEFELFST